MSGVETNEVSDLLCKLDECTESSTHPPSEPLLRTTLIALPSLLLRWVAKGTIFEQRTLQWNIFFKMFGSRSRQTDRDREEG